MKTIIVNKLSYHNLSHEAVVIDLVCCLYRKLPAKITCNYFTSQYTHYIELLYRKGDYWEIPVRIL